MNVSKEQALWFYRCMQEQREFELKAYELFRSGKMPGFIHLYVGEEAVAAGVTATCGKTITLPAPTAAMGTRWQKESLRARRWRN